MPKKPVKKQSGPKGGGGSVVDESPKPAPKPQPKEEPKRIVFRLFECIVHLEQAAEHINKVGIFPPGVEGMMESKARTLEHIDGLRRQYVGVWNEYQREAGR